MVSRLSVDGLVEVRSDRTLAITPAGWAAADADYFHRHALMERLLTRVIGLGWAESDEGKRCDSRRHLAAGRGRHRRPARSPDHLLRTATP